MFGPHVTNAIEITFILENVRQALESIKSIENELKELGAVTGLSSKKVDELGKGFKRFRREAQRFTTLLKAEFRWIAGFKIIGAISDAVSGTVDAFLTFDNILRQAQAITRATGFEFVQLENAILQTARTSIFSFSEVGKAAIILGQAGLSATEVANSLKAVVDLATATGGKLDVAANLLTSAMKTFNISAKDSYKIANIFAVAVNKSKLSLDSIATAFQYVAPVAAQTGESLQSVMALMGVLADKGLKASRIGASLRQVFASLLRPTSRFNQILKEYNITQDEVNLKTHKLVDILTVLRDKGVNVADVYYALGVRAATGFSYLIDSIDEVRKKEALLAETGVLQEMVVTVKSSVVNSFKLLRNEIQATAASARDNLGPLLSDIAISLTKSIRSLVDTFHSAAGSVIAFSTAMGAIGLSFVGLNNNIAALAGSLALLVPFFKELSSLLTKTTDKFNMSTEAAFAFSGALSAILLRSRPTLMAITLLGNAIMYLGAKHEEARRKFKEETAIPSYVEDLLNVLQDLKEISSTSAQNLTAYTSRLKDLRNVLENLIGRGIVSKQAKSIIEQINKFIFDPTDLEQAKILQKEAINTYSIILDDFEKSLLNKQKELYIKLKEEESKLKFEKGLSKSKFWSVMHVLSLGTSVDFKGRYKETKQNVLFIKRSLNEIDKLLKLIKEVREKGKQIASEEKLHPVSIGDILDRIYKEEGKRIRVRNLNSLLELRKALEENNKQLNNAINDFINTHKSYITNLNDYLSGKITIKQLKISTGAAQLNFLKQVRPFIVSQEKIENKINATKKKIFELNKEFQEQTRIIPNSVSQLNSLFNILKRIERISGYTNKELRQQFGKEVIEYIKNNTLSIQDFVKVLTIARKAELDLSSIHKLAFGSLLKYINTLNSVSGIETFTNNLERFKNKLKLSSSEYSKIFDIISSKLIELASSGQVGSRALKAIATNYPIIYKRFLLDINKVQLTNIDQLRQFISTIKELGVSSQVQGKIISNSFANIVKQASSFEQLNSFLELFTNEWRNINKIPFSNFENINTLISKISELAKSGNLNVIQLSKTLLRMGDVGKIVLDNLKMQKGELWLFNQAMVEGIRQSVDNSKTYLESWANFWSDTIDNMRNTFETGFVDILEGRIDKLDDVFKGFLYDIWHTFNQTIAQMLTRDIMNVIGLTSVGKGGKLTGLIGIVSNFIKGFWGAASGGIIPGKFYPLRQFSEGGLVKRATLGVVGEGKYPEAIVPLPNGRAIPVEMVNSSPIKLEQKIINVVDPQLIGDFLSSPSGQDILLNVLGSNASTIRRVILGG